jgi:hypothetical protein
MVEVKIATFDEVWEDDDNGFLPYITDTILKRIVSQLAPTIVEGMKTAAFRRLVILVVEMFRSFSIDELARDPLSRKKEMCLFGGYLRRRIMIESANKRAVTTFEREDRKFKDLLHFDSDGNPNIWCKNMFMDLQMDLDFYFESAQQGERFIHYLRRVFKVDVRLTPSFDYPGSRFRSFDVTSRLLDPMNISLKIDVITPRPNFPCFPDFTANILRQAPNGNVYIARSNYYTFLRGFAPSPSDMYSGVEALASILTRTIVEIENGITRLLLVPPSWFQTKEGVEYSEKDPFEEQDNEPGPEDNKSDDAPYTKYLHKIFDRLPKIHGLKIVNFENSVHQCEDGGYFVRCCNRERAVNSDSVSECNGSIVVQCIECEKKIVIFEDFLIMG